MRCRRCGQNHLPHCSVHSCDQLLLWSSYLLLYFRNHSELHQTKVYKVAQWCQATWQTTAGQLTKQPECNTQQNEDSKVQNIWQWVHSLMTPLLCCRINNSVSKAGETWFESEDTGGSGLKQHKQSGYQGVTPIWWRPQRLLIGTYNKKSGEGQRGGIWKSVLKQ